MTVVVEIHWVDLSFHPEPHFFFFFFLLEETFPKLLLDWGLLFLGDHIHYVTTFLLNPIKSSVKPALSASVQKPHIQVQLFIHMIFDLSQA